MAGAVLLDVNVLVALFTPEHVHHELAHDWFQDLGKTAWATCAVTQAGFVRVVSQLPREDGPLRPARALDHLRRFCGSSSHTFWAGDFPLTDPDIIRAEFLRGHQQVTDAYLLALACRMKGRLATFDRSIPLQAVKGTTKNHIEVISAAD